MSTASAELTKYAANALLATKISFINEISQIAELVGADVQEVKRGIALDYRINPAFLNAGCGFGGSCFPKDLKGLEHLAKTYHFEPWLISSVLQRNAAQQAILFSKLQRYFGDDLQGKTIAVWGLSFKPHTDDIRCASSLVLIDALLQANAYINAYDPLAMEAVAQMYPDCSLQLRFCEHAIAATASADALILVTEWPEFNAIALAEIRRHMRTPVIIDGRNMLSPSAVLDAGFDYVGVGRQHAHRTTDTAVMI